MLIVSVTKARRYCRNMCLLSASYKARTDIVRVRVYCVTEARTDTVTMCVYCERHTKHVETLFGGKK